MTLLVFLVIAAALGWWIGNRRLFGLRTRHAGHVVMIGAVGLLLFGMGLSLGQRPEIVSQMGTFGLRAASLALAGGIGAIIAVGVVRRVWKKRP